MNDFGTILAFGRFAFRRLKVREVDNTLVLRSSGCFPTGDPLEERIHQLQAKKSQLADSLLTDAARAAAPDESTLSALLAPLG